MKVPIKTNWAISCIRRNSFFNGLKIERSFVFFHKQILAVWVILPYQELWWEKWSLMWNSSLISEAALGLYKKIIRQQKGVPCSLSGYGTRQTVWHFWPVHLLNALVQTAPLTVIMRTLRRQVRKSQLIKCLLKR